MILGSLNPKINFPQMSKKGKESFDDKDWIDEVFTEMIGKVFKHEKKRVEFDRKMKYIDLTVDNILHESIVNLIPDLKKVDKKEIESKLKDSSVVFTLVISENNGEYKITDDKCYVILKMDGKKYDFNFNIYNNKHDSFINDVYKTLAN